MSSRTVIDKLGSDVLRAALGVSESSIKEARRNGFPANWFDVIDALGRKHGVEVPRAAFNFRAPKSPIDGTDEARLKPELS